MSDRLEVDHIISFGIGLGIGAALAMLFAPRSGEDTREYLLDGATDSLDDLTEAGRKLRRRVQRSVNGVARAVMDATETAQRAHHKAKTAEAK